MFNEQEILNGGSIKHDNLDIIKVSSITTEKLNCRLERLSQIQSVIDKYAWSEAEKYYSD